MSDVTRDDIVRELLPTGIFSRDIVERVVDAFGADATRILNTTKADLKEIPGVGRKRAAKLRRRLDFLQRYGFHRSERTLVESIFERSQVIEYVDDLVMLLEAVGERVVYVYWDTGGGFGAGAGCAYRIGDVFVNVPGYGIEYTSGPYEFFDDVAPRVLWLSTAVREVHCTYPVEEWIHAAGIQSDILEVAPDHTISINGEDWSMARLWELQEKAGPPPERHRTLPLPDGCDLERCQAAILDGYRNGSLDLSLETIDRLLEEDRYYV